ncbi:MAG TPA: carboxypeptidase-like regulatory domain-containing protein [Bryobacteraceae bacterium]|nr:carboxypeptidase-like regulatory domain-containing protein [Bryobacteraceae bacterium]
MSKHIRFAFLLAFMLFWAISSVIAFQAQDARGNIVGRVTDPTGAVIPATDVRAINTATGVTVAAKTNESGNYVLPYLPPGFYTVQAEIKGFNKFVRDKVEIRVSDRVELNIQMLVGDISQAVEVTAETPLLQTAEASLGQVVDERRIMELPLFAGNAMDLVHLAPGTVNGTDMRLRKAPFNNAPSQFSTDGSGNYGNSFTIDGVSNVYSDGTQPRVAFSPPTASLAEFKVETSAFDAGAGRTMGSVVNVSTKGGSNKLHGQAWEWLRHSALDSSTLFQNKAIPYKKPPKYQDNRFGLAGGGPVYIPGLYNGKNKTFWHFTFEEQIFGDPNVGGSMISTVPREQWKNGDLSDLLAIGKTYQIYDPATIKAVSGGRFSRDPFPGNIIPKSRLDPTGQKILGLYPSPNNTAAQTVDGRNNFFMALPAKEFYWTTIGRVDHAFSEQNRIFVRFHRDFWEEDKNRNFGNDVNGIILNRTNRGIALDDVHMFTPTFLLNFRYGLSQQDFPQRRTSAGFDLASLGFSPNLVGLIDPSVATIPRTAVGSLTTLSQWEGNGDGITSSISHSFVGNFTWMRGNHNLRFGTEFTVFREFQNRYPQSASPDLNFNNVWGRGPLDSDAAPTVGGELTALLLGIPGGSMVQSASYAEQDKYLGFYIQDDFKISRKLTLNLGLRMEHESPITERFNRAVTQWDAVSSNPIEAAAIAKYALKPMPELPVSAFSVKGGVTFAGVGGNPREYWSGSALNLMPRLGLAYQVTPKTVLRGGFGIFFGSNGILSTNSVQNGFSRSTTISPSPDSGLTFTANLANPLPTGLLPVLGAAGGLETTLNQNVTVFAKERQSPYAQRWSLGLQRQLAGGFVVESSYVGNRNTRLAVTRNINATPGQYYSTSPVRDNATNSWLTANFTNPYYGLNPQFTSSNISRQNLLKPYPHFGEVNFADSVGYSWYHSMQTRLEKRFSKGYTLQTSYTWSKAMEATQFLNNFDAMPYETLGDIDRTHRLTGSGIWELPFGRKRHFGGGWHPVLNFIGGGWQLGGVYQFQSGQPIGWGNILFTGNPDDVKLSSGERTWNRWFNTEPFNKVSNQQLVNNVRTFPFRFSSLRADTQRRWDFSLSKDFVIREGISMKFRADTFNAFNQVVLRGPQANPTNSSFGQTSAQEPPRSWQFGLRLVF